jgi:hypothetical protein
VARFSSGAARPLSTLLGVRRQRRFVLYLWVTVGAGEGSTSPRQMPLIISFIPVSACRPVTRRRESPGILGEERDAEHQVWDEAT